MFDEDWAPGPFRPGHKPDRKTKEPSILDFIGGPKPTDPNRPGSQTLRDRGDAVLRDLNGMEYEQWRDGPGEKATADIYGLIADIEKDGATPAEVYDLAEAIKANPKLWKRMRGGEAALADLEAVRSTQDTATDTVAEMEFAADTEADEFIRVTDPLTYAGLKTPVLASADPAQAALLVAQADERARNEEIDAALAADLLAVDDRHQSYVAEDKDLTADFATFTAGGPGDLDKLNARADAQLHEYAAIVLEYAKAHADARDDRVAAGSILRDLDLVVAKATGDFTYVEDVEQERRNLDTITGLISQLPGPNSIRPEPSRVMVRADLPQNEKAQIQAQAEAAAKVAATNKYVDAVNTILAFTGVADQGYTAAIHAPQHRPLRDKQLDANGVVGNLGDMRMPSTGSTDLALGMRAKHVMDDGWMLEEPESKRVPGHMRFVAYLSDLMDRGANPLAGSSQDDLVHKAATWSDDPVDVAPSTAEQVLGAYDRWGFSRDSLLRQSRERWLVGGVGSTLPAAERDRLAGMVDESHNLGNPLTWSTLNENSQNFAAGAEIAYNDHFGSPEAYAGEVSSPALRRQNLFVKLGRDATTIGAGAASLPGLVVGGGVVEGVNRVEGAVSMIANPEKHARYIGENDIGLALVLGPVGQSMTNPDLAFADERLPGESDTDYYNRVAPLTGSFIRTPVTNIHNRWFGDGDPKKDYGERPLLTLLEDTMPLMVVAAPVSMVARGAARSAASAALRAQAELNAMKGMPHSAANLNKARALQMARDRAWQRHDTFDTIQAVADVPVYVTMAPFKAAGFVVGRGVGAVGHMATAPVAHGLQAASIWARQSSYAAPVASAGRLAASADMFAAGATRFGRMAESTRSLLLHGGLGSRMFGATGSVVNAILGGREGLRALRKNGFAQDPGVAYRNLGNLRPWAEDSPGALRTATDDVVEMVYERRKAEVEAKIAARRKEHGGSTDPVLEARLEGLEKSWKVIKEHRGIRDAVTPSTGRKDTGSSPDEPARSRAGGNDAGTAVDSRTRANEQAAARIRSQADEDTGSVRSEADEETAKVREQADKKAEAVRAQADKDTDAVRAQADKDIAKVRAQAEKKAAAIREKADEEGPDAQVQADRDLAAVRAEAELDVAAIRARAQRDEAAVRTRAVRDEAAVRTRAVWDELAVRTGAEQEAAGATGSASRPAGEPAGVTPEDPGPAPQGAPETVVPGGDPAQADPAPQGGAVAAQPGPAKPVTAAGGTVDAAPPGAHPPVRSAGSGAPAPVQDPASQSGDAALHPARDPPGESTTTPTPGQAADTPDGQLQPDDAQAVPPGTRDDVSSEPGVGSASESGPRAAVGIEGAGNGVNGEPAHRPADSPRPEGPQGPDQPNLPASPPRESAGGGGSSGGGSNPHGDAAAAAHDPPARGASDGDLQRADTRGNPREIDPFETDLPPPGADSATTGKTGDAGRAGHQVPAAERGALRAGEHAGAGAHGSTPSRQADVTPEGAASRNDAEQGARADELPAAAHDNKEADQQTGTRDRDAAGDVIGEHKQQGEEPRQDTGRKTAPSTDRARDQGTTPGGERDATQAIDTARARAAREAADAVARAKREAADDQARARRDQREAEPPLGAEQNCACVHDAYADAPDPSKVDPSQAPKATRDTQDTTTVQEHLENKYDGRFEETSQEQLDRDMAAADPGTRVSVVTEAEGGAGHLWLGEKSSDGTVRYYDIDHPDGQALTEAPQNVRAAMVHGSGKGNGPRLDLRRRHRYVGTTSARPHSSESGDEPGAVTPRPHSGSRPSAGASVPASHGGRGTPTEQPTPSAPEITMAELEAKARSARALDESELEGMDQTALNAWTEKAKDPNSPYDPEVAGLAITRRNIILDDLETRPNDVRELRDSQMMTAVVAARQAIAGLPPSAGKSLSLEAAATIEYILQARGLSPNKGVEVWTHTADAAIRDSAEAERRLGRLGIGVGHDYAGLDVARKREANAADVTFVHYVEAEHNVLRDRSGPAQYRVLGERKPFTLVDEVDKIAGQRARESARLSVDGEGRPGHADDLELARELVPQLRLNEGQPNPHVEVMEGEHAAVTEAGKPWVKELTAKQGKPVDLTDPANAPFEEALNTALTAEHALRENRDYRVDREKNEIHPLDGDDTVRPGHHYDTLLDNALRLKHGMKELRPDSRTIDETAPKEVLSERQFGGTTGSPDAETFKSLYNKQSVDITPEVESKLKVNEERNFKNPADRDAAAVEAAVEGSKTDRPQQVFGESQEALEAAAAHLPEGTEYQMLHSGTPDAEVPLIVARAGKPGMITFISPRGTRAFNYRHGGDPAELAKHEISRRGLDPDSPEAQAVRDALAKRAAQDRKKINNLGGFQQHRLGKRDHPNDDKQERLRVARNGEPGETTDYLSRGDSLLRKGQPTTYTTAKTTTTRGGELTAERGKTEMHDIAQQLNVQRELAARQAGPSGRERDTPSQSVTKPGDSTGVVDTNAEHAGRYDLAALAALRLGYNPGLSTEDFEQAKAAAELPVEYHPDAGKILEAAGTVADAQKAAYVRSVVDAAVRLAELIPARTLRLREYTAEDISELAERQQALVNELRAFEHRDAELLDRTGMDSDQLDATLAVVTALVEEQRKKDDAEKADENKAEKEVVGDKRAEGSAAGASSESPAGTGRAAVPADVEPGQPTDSAPGPRVNAIPVEQLAMFLAYARGASIEGIAKDPMFSATEVAEVTEALEQVIAQLRQLQGEADPTGVLTESEARDAIVERFLDEHGSNTPGMWKHVRDELRAMKDHGVSWAERRVLWNEPDWIENFVAQLPDRAADRVYQALLDAGITSLSQLAALSPTELAGLGLPVATTRSLRRVLAAATVPDRSGAGQRGQASLLAEHPDWGHDDLLAALRLALGQHPDPTTPATDEQLDAWLAMLGVTELGVLADLLPAEATTLLTRARAAQLTDAELRVLAAHAAGAQRRSTDSGRAQRVALLVMAAHVQAKHGRAPPAETAEPVEAPTGRRWTRPVIVTAAVGAGGGLAVLAGVTALTVMFGGTAGLGVLAGVALTVHLVRNRGPPAEARVTPLAGRAAERNRIARVLIQAPLGVPMRLRPAAVVLAGIALVGGGLPALAVPTAPLVVLGAVATAAAPLVSAALRHVVAHSPHAARAGLSLPQSREQDLARAGVLGVLTTARPGLGLVGLVAFFGPGLVGALPVAGGALLAAVAVQAIVRRVTPELDSRADMVAMTAIGLGLIAAPAGVVGAVAVGGTFALAAAVIALLRAGDRPGLTRVLGRMAIALGLSAFLLFAGVVPVAAAPPVWGAVPGALASSTWPYQSALLGVPMLGAVAYGLPVTAGAAPLVAVAAAAALVVVVVLVRKMSTRSDERRARRPGFGDAAGRVGVVRSAWPVSSATPPSGISSAGRRSLDPRAGGPLAARRTDGGVEIVYRDSPLLAGVDGPIAALAPGRTVATWHASGVDVADVVTVPGLATVVSDVSGVWILFWVAERDGRPVVLVDPRVWDGFGTLPEDVQQKIKSRELRRMAAFGDEGAIQHLRPARWSRGQGGC